MQRINEWEIYYLLVVDPYKFVDSLKTKHFFYDFISKDEVKDNSDLIVTNSNEQRFNSVTIVLIYVCITNIINDYFRDSLNNRHHYFKCNKTSFSFNRIIFECWVEGYKPDSTTQLYNLTISLMSLNNSYKQVSRHSPNIQIRDTPNIQIRANTLQTYEHKIIITNIDSNFFTTIILMYQDFIDNIPLPTL